MQSRVLCLATRAIFVVLLTLTAAFAQNTNVPPLVRTAVDDSIVTTLRGNTYPLAIAKFDRGAAPDSLPMERMLLVLKRSGAQESALRQLLDDQQDRSSPNFHKWLTPEAFGQKFGPADSDIQAVAGWLLMHGFQVAGPSKGRTVIEFSGTAGQVKEAFHTEIHKFAVNDEEHWANASDPQIPSALTPVVAGVWSLHNFQKRPNLVLGKEKFALTPPPVRRPYVALQGGSNALGPGDYAVIYGMNSAYQAGIKGNNTTIGVVGRSNISTQDLANFYSVFQVGALNVTVQLNGPDPGNLGGGEEIEAVLDTSWSSSLAPAAQTIFVVSSSTNTTDGVDLSEFYIIENNLADVMTESFGACEAAITASGLVGVSALAEQAAAQGITYLLSSGDPGAAGCDNPNTASATGGLAVSGLASTPFNTAVGGTLFNENGQTSKYWSSTNNASLTNALSYIPEDVWNESCSNSQCGSAANLFASGGGASGFFPKPNWQAGVSGIPSDHARDLPDVSLAAAAGHDPYLICVADQGADCVTGLIGVGGTSASSPAFAGIMALVVQKNGGRVGLANYVLYRLAATETLSQCNGSSTSGPPANTCIFNDTTVGNNSVPGLPNYGTSNAQYKAGVGYDQATGLGSVNVTNLVNKWSSVTFNPTTTTLSLNPTTNVTHGNPVNVNIGVTPKSAGATPTGDVSLIAVLSGSQQGVDGFTLTNGTVASTTSFLLGGSYQVHAHYAGDATYGGSDSAATAVNVVPEGSVTVASAIDINGNPLAASVPYGTAVFLRADVAGLSNQGVPTGTVAFVDGPATDFQGTLNSGGNIITPNGLTPSAGSHSVVANYGGDPSFNASASTAVAFTITPTVAATLSPITILAPGQSGTTTLTVSGGPGYNSTYTFSCSGLPSESACSFSPASVVGNASTTITVTTTPKSSAQLRVTASNHLPISGGFLLAGVLLAGIPSKRRWKRAMLLIAVAGLLGMVGCGGSSSGGGGNPGTPTGTYQITVSSSPSGLTSNFTLTVQ